MKNENNLIADLQNEIFRLMRRNRQIVRANRSWQTINDRLLLISICLTFGIVGLIFAGDYTQFLDWFNCTGVC